MATVSFFLEIWKWPWFRPGFRDLLGGFFCVCAGDHFNPRCYLRFPNLSPSPPPSPTLHPTHAPPTYGRYPSDEVLLNSFRREAQWREYKHQVTTQVLLPHMNKACRLPRGALMDRARRQRRHQEVRLLVTLRRNKVKVDRKAREEKARRLALDLAQLRAQKVGSDSQQSSDSNGGHDDGDCYGDDDDDDVESLPLAQLQALHLRGVEKQNVR